MAINPHFPNANHGLDKVDGSGNAPVTTSMVRGRSSSPPEADPQAEVAEEERSGAAVDQQLVQRTKLQIRALVREIADLSQSNCSVEDFYKGFLTRTVSALASVGGAIWVRPEADEPLQLSYQINLKNTGLVEDSEAQQRHGRLLNQLLETKEPSLVAPHSGSDTADEAGNPTEHLLLVGPLDIDQQTAGLVEIFQRTGAGPATQRGYLRFLTQMCEIASDFLRNQKLRAFHEQQRVWQDLEQFIRQVHSGLDRDQVLFHIVNEGRRFLDCDRVSAAVLIGSRVEIRAVSGLDSVERRAEQVKQLAMLTQSVIRSREPLWYNGDDRDLPPQMEEKIHDYVDRSHSKLVGVLPLYATPSDSEREGAMERTDGRSHRQPLGALIVERLSDATFPETLRKRAERVVEHSQQALSNVTEHHSIFMMPVWRAVGKSLSIFRGTNLMKTTAILSSLAAVILFLCWYSYPFALSAKGVLKPGAQHDVFATVDGVLSEVYLSDSADSVVRKGQLLAQMTNSDLMLELENLDGELQRIQKSLAAMTRARTQPMSSYEQIMLDGEYNEAMETSRSLSEKLKIKREEAAQLSVISPADGQVINWQIRQNLLRRPVSRGQKLMTVIDPNTVWQIELELPERRVSHLIEAMRESDQPIEVTFALASYPGKELVGQLLSMDRQLNVYSEEGNSVRLRVTFDNRQVPVSLLRSGTRVNAQLQCGSRSVGYVFFQDVIETVQSSYMFWF